MKQDGDIAVFEGKRHLTYQQYTKIVHFSLSNCTDFNLMTFAHAYITLCWNLMARTNNVALLKFEHISWENDALIVTLPKHKGDQVS